MSAAQLEAILAQGGEPGPDFADPPARARAAFAALLAGLPVAPDVTVAEAVVGGVPGRWASTPESADGVLLFLHGGAYVAGDSLGYLSLAAELGRAAGRRVLVPDYRLAPEHRFPAAVDDALAVYRALLDAGETPVVAGDSAGGGLALALLIALQRQGLPQPASAVLLSPWADLRCGSASMDARAGIDPLLTPAGLRAAAQHYLGAAEAAEPLASPAIAAGAGLAPVHVHVGEREILHDDALLVAERIRAAGGEVTLREWPGMVHDWSFFWFALDEAAELVAEVGAQLRDGGAR